MWVNIYYRPPGQDLPTFTMKRYSPDWFSYHEGMVLCFNVPVRPEDERIEDVTTASPPVPLLVEFVVANMQGIQDKPDMDRVHGNGGLDGLAKPPVQFDVFTTHVVSFCKQPVFDPGPEQLEAVGFSTLMRYPAYITHWVS